VPIIDDVTLWRLCLFVLIVLAIVQIKLSSTLRVRTHFAGDATSHHTSSNVPIEENWANASARNDKADEIFPKLYLTFLYDLTVTTIVSCTLAHERDYRQHFAMADWIDTSHSSRLQWRKRKKKMWQTNSVAILSIFSFAEYLPIRSEVLRALTILEIVQ
jgi:hypothetical protein